MVNLAEHKTSHSRNETLATAKDTAWTKLNLTKHLTPKTGRICGRSLTAWWMTHLRIWKQSVSALFGSQSQTRWQLVLKRKRRTNPPARTRPTRNFWKQSSPTRWEPPI